jgi:uncharacterized protein YuzE
MKIGSIKNILQVTFKETYNLNQPGENIYFIFLESVPIGETIKSTKWYLYDTDLEHNIKIIKLTLQQNEAVKFTDADCDSSIEILKNNINIDICYLEIRTGDEVETIDINGHIFVESLDIKDTNSPTTDVTIMNAIDYCKESVIICHRCNLALLNNDVLISMHSCCILCVNCANEFSNNLKKTIDKINIEYIKELKDTMIVKKLMT